MDWRLQTLFYPDPSARVWRCRKHRRTQKKGERKIADQFRDLPKIFRSSSFLLPLTARASPSLPAMQGTFSLGWGEGKKRTSLLSGKTLGVVIVGGREAAGRYLKGGGGSVVITAQANKKQPRNRKQA